MKHRIVAEIAHVAVFDHLNDDAQKVGKAMVEKVDHFCATHSAVFGHGVPLIDERLHGSCDRRLLATICLRATQSIYTFSSIGSGEN